MSAETNKRTTHSGRTRIRALFSTLVSTLILSVLTGCGYQFRVEGIGPTIGGAQPTASQEPPPRMIVHTLINKSFEPNLETRYTNYIRSEFTSGSGAQVVPDSEVADLILTGEILSVMTPTLSFGQTRTLESRAEIVVRVQVEETRTNKVVWTQLARGASEFYVTSDLQFNRALQNRALEQAGRLVAADLAARFLLHVESDRLAKPATETTPATP